VAPKNYPTSIPSLSEVKEQFKIWRRTRKSPRPIPEKLWEAAVSLTANHSISQISKELVLGYTGLKKRVSTCRKDTLSRILRSCGFKIDNSSKHSIAVCIFGMKIKEG